MVNNSLENILKVADCVINNPATTLLQASSMFGVKISATTGLIAGTLVFSPVYTIPVILLKTFQKYNRKNQEKERMKNEIICKQQAIIQELQQQNKYNKQEIQNLKDTLIMLEDVIKKMEAA